VRTAVLVDLDRFATPGKLVAYFGVLPIARASGVDRDGPPRGVRRYVMSRRGNDLVRRYLWMAALSAVRCNPAVRALYRRVVAKHPQQQAIAIGHAMRKLLHLVFAVGKSGRPFDPKHSPWEGPDLAGGDGTTAVEPGDGQSDDSPRSAEGQAAGHKPGPGPAGKGVTAACPGTVPPAEAVGAGTAIDFAHLKGQLRMAAVLDHLGLSSRLRGSGVQRRCACPIHRGDNRGRTFSVNLGADVFHCFEKTCGQKGDVIDLWAAVHRLSLPEAALDLVRTFHLEPTPVRGIEKRHG
jgi:Transposase IS116/IS110/IS902 family/CHC2 zinc finger